MVLGVMGLMAAVGLAFALLTVQVRRSHDFKPKPTNPVVAPVAEAVPPIRLAALGYLPPDTNFVAGFHVAEAMQTPTGRAFLDRSRLGDSSLSLASIERTTGLKRHNIDHAVLGIRLADGQTPRALLVVRTLTPFDKEQVRAALKANRSVKVGAKEAYYFDLEKPPLLGLLWFADARTLAVGLTKEDLHAVPSPLAVNGEQLPPPLAELIRSRMTLGSQAWVAGHIENWGLLRLLTGQVLSDEANKAAVGVRTFGFWVRLGTTVEAHAAIRCVDAEAATRLEKALAQGLKRGSDYLRVFGSSPEGEKVADELARECKISQTDGWVTLQTTASAEAVRKAVGGP
jgi:hypothetical protein